jgi:diguanylate cyclase (GGDEF)-like protein
MKGLNIKKFFMKKENSILLNNLVDIFGDNVGVFDIEGNLISKKRPSGNIVYFPIKLGEETIGHVSGESKAENLASVISSFVEARSLQRTLADEILRKYKEQDLLYNINDETSLCPKTEEIADFIIHELSKLINFEYASILIFDERESILKPLSSFGDSLWIESIKNDIGIINEKAFESGTGEIASGNLTSAGTPGSSVYSIMSIPLKARKRSIGIINIGSRKKLYMSDDFKILSAIASYIANSIEVMRLYNVAYYDPLTGLPNRRLFNEHMLRALARTDRSGNFMAVCFLDLDYFKAINDKYGHDAGDIVLVNVAEKISSVLRKTDMLTRIGGDEFVLLIENFARKSDINTVLSKIENIFAEQYINIGHDITLFVSYSMGVCIYPGEHGETDMAALLENADKAMYISKKSKKDRVKPWTVYGNEDGKNQLF